VHHKRVKQLEISRGEGCLLCSALLHQRIPPDIYHKSTGKSVTLCDVEATADQLEVVVLPGLDEIEDYNDKAIASGLDFVVHVSLEGSEYFTVRQRLFSAYRVPYDS
jgi:hypothetical protein